jgi:hypothetical protein
MEWEFCTTCITAYTVITDEPDDQWHFQWKVPCQVIARQVHVSANQRSDHTACHSNKQVFAYNCPTSQQMEELPLHCSYPIMCSYSWCSSGIDGTRAFRYCWQSPSGTHFLLNHPRIADSGTSFSWMTRLSCQFTYGTPWVKWREWTPRAALGATPQ